MAPISAFIEMDATGDIVHIPGMERWHLRPRARTQSSAAHRSAILKAAGGGIETFLCLGITYFIILRRRIKTFHQYIETLINPKRTQ
jgi:hypothetical protein